MAKRIVIFSTKGGVGKTFVATNLAVSLVQDQAKRVCLIDFDVQAPGDMARMLNLNPSKSVAELMAMLKAHPQTLRKEDFIIKTQFGIDFLPGVLRPQQAGHFETGELKAALDFIDKDYDYIVIDAGKSLSNIFVSILNLANLILLIATPDLVAIYQTKWILDTLQSLGFPLAMIQCVLNRAESVSGISWQEVKVNLPINIIANIPSEGRVVGLA
jgi:pilus assembly protein CpaE